MEQKHTTRNHTEAPRSSTYVRRSSSYIQRFVRLPKTIQSKILGSVAYDPEWLERQLQANNIGYAKNLLTPFDLKRIPKEFNDSFKWIIHTPLRTIQGIKRMRYYTVKEWRRFASGAMVWVMLISMVVNFWPTPAQAQSYTFGSSGKGFLVYDDTTGGSMGQRQWNYGNTAFGSESVKSFDDVFQTVIKASPVVKDFWVMAVADASGNLTIKESTDGGSTWNSGVTEVTGGTGTTRRFDVAFEQQSGEAVVAYSMDATTNEIGVRRYTSSWQSEATWDPSNTDTVVTWVELAEKANSDELAIGYATNDSAATIVDTNAAIWDGSSNSFGSEPGSWSADCESISAAGDNKCFDLNYETGSGRPVMSWGINAAAGAADAVRATRWDGSTWTTTTIDIVEDASVIDCAQDPSPGSLEITCGTIGNGGDDHRAWVIQYVGTGGSGCGSQTVYMCSVLAGDTAAHLDGAGQMLVATFYVVSNGARRAISAYADGTSGAHIDYYYWDGGAWSSVQTGAASLPTTIPENLIAETNPYNYSEAIIAAGDNATTSDLYASKITFSGSGAPVWSAADGGAALEDALAHKVGPAFNLAFEPPVPPTKLTQDGYIWENDDALGGTFGNSQPSGPNNGATFANDAGVGSEAWINTSNAATSNNSYAAAGLSAGEASNYLKATDFGFSIPTTASVAGIVVEVERNRTNPASNVFDSHAKIVKNDTISSTNRATGTGVPTTDTYISWGSDSDLWGESWTASDINSNNFGFVYAVYEEGTDLSNVNVDHIRITVYYSTPDVNGATQQAAGNTAITNVRKGERLTLRTQIKNTGTGYLNDDLALFYDRNDGIWSKVTAPKPAVTAAGSCTDTAWECVNVDSPGTSTGHSVSMAVGPNGLPAMSYYYQENKLGFARYVGSGGTGCTGNTTWTCVVIDDPTNTVGWYTSLAFDPKGNPWIAYYDFTGGDLKVAQYVGSGGTGCTAGTTNAAWNCTTIANTDEGEIPSLTFDTAGSAWITYIDGTEQDLEIARYVGAGGSGCSTAITTWTCTDIDTFTTFAYSSIAINPANGQPWVTYWDNFNVVVAQYVGSGGNCDSSAWACTTVVGSNNLLSESALAFDADGTAWITYIGTTDSLRVAKFVGGGSGSGCTSSDWDCTTIHSGIEMGDIDGSSASLAMDPSGTPWIAYWEEYTTNCTNNSPTTECSLRVARYVGSGGTGCDSSAWTCTLVKDPPAFENHGAYASLAFAPDGTAWIGHGAGSDLHVSYTKRGGEITMAPGLSGANGDAISESHADMGTPPDDTDRDDADCLTATTWNNGKWFESEEASGVNLAKGDATAQCTEIAFTIDTSQATYGQTYRFIVVSKDGFRSDKGIWRGPVAVASGAYATLTIATADMSIKRFSKDNTPTFTDCTANASWGCLTVDDRTDDVALGSSLAFDPTGTPWIAHQNNITAALIVSKYVGSGGNCDSVGTGSDAWECTTVDDRTNVVGNNPSLAFDPSGTPWISHNNSSIGALVISKYVGSGGNCDSVGTGSDAWECTTVDDRTDTVGSDSSLAFAPDGTPWVAYRNNTAAALIISKYVGSGGNCDSVGTGSDAWECTTVDDRTDAVAETPSLAIDANGTPWVAHRNSTAANALIVSKYVGSGGNCDSVGTGSDAWECTTVDDRTDAVGYNPSIAVDPSGVPWITYKNESADSLIVSKYVGGTNGTCASVGTGSNAWDCTTVDDRTDTVGDSPSLAFDASGTPWVAYTNSSTFALIVSKYVGGTNGTCASVGTGSNAWDCTTVDDRTDTVGAGSSLAFDFNGTPWVSHRNSSTGALVVSKLHMPFSKPTATTLNLYNGRNATRSDARYHLDRGRSPGSDRDGVCSSNAGNEGYCGVFADDGNYDSMGGINERPMFVFAQRGSTNSRLPTAKWVGRSNVAPNSASTAGDIKLQVYRFGTTNAWEDITTDSSSSDCSSQNCTLSGMPTGTVSEYFETDGSEYWIYFRVWQYESTGYELLKTDQFTILDISDSLRHGTTFQETLERPFSW